MTGYASLAQACHRIASAYLDGERAEPRLGSIALLPHQQDGVTRVRRALRAFGGALLADEVGLGKTYVALAVARDFPSTEIVAPAGLLPMWRDAVGRTEVSHCRVHSLHRLSRGTESDWERAATGGLVIVDEAHALRNASTRRYLRLARAVVGRTVLLLSATPLHNRARELSGLLALFLGSRADALEDALLERLVVRRLHAPSAELEVPAVAHERIGLRTFDERTLLALRDIPPPAAARDGAIAAALVRNTLLRAWNSSEAALDGALRRRVLRGEALRDALRSGALPDRQALRAWTIGDDAGQLAFPELLISDTMQASADDLSTLRGALDRHLAWCDALIRDRALRGVDDRERVDALECLLRRHAPAPVVVFSHFAESVEAMYRALRRVGGVAMLTSRGARIASGRISRAEALERFAPVAQRRSSAKLAAHERIRLLLSTDLLSEGVNLQDAGVVVHLDLPWTEALLRQRIGRVARLASPHARVHSYPLLPPTEQLRELRIVERLLRKSAQASRLVGAADPSHSRDATHEAGVRGATSAAERATEVRRVLLRWREERGADSRALANDDVTVAAFVGRAPAPSIGVAVVLADGAPRLLAVRGDDPVVGRSSTGVLRVSHDLEAVVEAIRRIDADRAHPGAHRCAAEGSARLQVLVRNIAQAIGAWHEDVTVRASTGPPACALSPAQREGLRALAASVGRLNATRRLALAPAVAAAHRMIVRAHYVGAEPTLMRWADGSGDAAPERWLSAWRADPLLVRVADATTGSSAADAASRAGGCRLLMALVLVGGDSTSESGG